MSALGGGFNRSTQHSISFFLLGFESQGLCTLPAIPKVPVFSAAVEPRKYPRRIVAHSIFPIQDRECCVDRLNRQPIADIGNLHSIVSLAAISNAAGTVRPSVFAVLRLTTNSNLFGCSTGRSPGFAPMRIRST